MDKRFVYLVLILLFVFSTLTFAANTGTAPPNQNNTIIAPPTAPSPMPPIQYLSEEVKCVFNGTTTTQECYPIDFNFTGCSGNDTCVVNVSGPNGAMVTWKSTCGGYAYTVIDGQNEYATFNCQSQTCTDTDEGKDYFVFGKVVDSSGVYYDSCVQNQDATVSSSQLLIDEYYCDGSQVYHETTNCPSDSSCVDGACVSNSTVKKESVKCVFDNSTSTQNCYDTAGKYSCSGVSTCVMDVEGVSGEKIEWKSSCGNYAYTVIDGSNDYAKFDCSTADDLVKEEVKCLFNNSTSPQECYAYSDGASFSCKTSSSSSCVATVYAPIGQELTWKSTCGGYAYTIVDGSNEYAKFDCLTNVCNASYDPVCGETTVCSTCSANSTDSNLKTTCNGTCEIIKQTYNNMCELENSGATFLYKGMCGGETQEKESVKCVFNDTTNQQKCYSDKGSCATNPTASSYGTSSCYIENINGYSGEQVTWKSTCGGYAYTLMDGTNEYAKFDCEAQPTCACTLEYMPVCGADGVTYGNKCAAGCANVAIVGEGECTTTIEQKCGVSSFGVAAACTDGFQKANWKCYDGTESYQGGASSCKSSDLWNSYAEEFCANKCSNTKSFFCGGLAGVQCPSGYTCQYNSTGPDASGTCLQSCPVYDMPMCKEDESVVQVSDDTGCSVPKCMPQSSTDFFKGVYWKCSNGMEFKESMNDCKPYAYWKEFARQKCAQYSSKCGSTPVPVSTTTTSSATGNFLLEVAAAVTNTVTAPQPTTTSDMVKCVGGEVYLTDLQTFDQCRPNCETTINSNGCKKVKCEGSTEQIYCDSTCLAQPMEEISSIKAACEKQNGAVIVSLDSNNCNSYSCVQSTTQCVKVEDIPQEKYLYCEDNNGKILTQTDESGCILVMECVSSTIDQNYTIDSTVIQDETTLLALALKLETLKIELEKVAQKTSAIAEYYRGVGDTNSAEKFDKATQLLQTGIQKIAVAKQLIKDNVSNFTETQARQVKDIIDTIRVEILREVLLTLLE